MIQPTSITRSNRKTLSLSISKMGEVAVKAPLYVSNEKINEFIKSKQDWIISKLKSIKKNINDFDDIIKYENILIFGDRFKPVFSQNKQIDIDDYGKLLIPEKFNSPEKVYKKTKDWLKSLAKNIVLERAEHLAKCYKLSPNVFKINDSKGRWGACNSRKEIILNFRIVMLPPFLLDYVIVHELAHLIEMNHSSKFWQVVSIFMPNFQVARKQIKNYSFCLGMFN